MPGVPSGRGCDGCRKQKKKCDQNKPCCSRCARLDIPCIGAGTQRYKFKEELGTSIASFTSRSTTHRSVPASPANQLMALANGLINSIKWSTDLRFNLVWSYGIFLTEVPPRLGNNEALDTAVEALVDAHSTACCLRKPTTGNLVIYSKALNKLKSCLDDPAQATSTETLAAVMILLICQNILGISNRHYTGHGEGAALILKARGRYYNPHDKFESMLLLSLRGPVVFEGCFNPRIKFTCSEWETLIVNHLDASQPVGRMMRCVARMPDFIRRGKAALSDGTTDPALIADMRENYEALRSTIPEFRVLLASLEAGREMKASTSYLGTEMQMHTVHQRLYGLALAIGIMLNLALSSLDFVSVARLKAENEEFVAEILSIWRNIANYKPIGSVCLQLYLNLAWAGTSNVTQRQEIERILEEMETEFVTGSLPRPTHEELVEMENHLRLQGVSVFDI